MSSLSSSAPARPANQTATGIAYGAAAGALWGLVFLAPKLVGDFGPLHLSAGRYLCYGLIALALIAPRWRALRPHISRRHWGQLCWLALAGNTLYYILLSSAVQIGGIAMTSLVIGFLPVAVTLVGSREHGAVPLRRMLPSMLLCALGALCIGWQALAAPVAGHAGQQLLGLACAVGALVSWTAFAIGNARCLARLQQVSAHEWSLLTGLVTGAQSLLLIPLALLFETGDHGTQEWARFVGVSVAVALLASVVGNAFWNRMSRLLPLTLVGQMILFETVFALCYGLLWESRLPTLAEMAAFACVVLGVLSCLAAHRQPVARQPAPGAGACAAAQTPCP